MNNYLVINENDGMAYNTMNEFIEKLNVVGTINNFSLATRTVCLNDKSNYIFIGKNNIEYYKNLRNYKMITGHFIKNMLNNYDPKLPFDPEIFMSKNKSFEIKSIKVNTPDGYKFLEDLKIGDYIIDGNGKKAMITSIYT